MSKRLSDTDALSKVPVPKGPKFASDSWSAPTYAEDSVARNSLGQFRRETGAGDSSLSTAVRCAAGYSSSKE